MNDFRICLNNGVPTVTFVEYDFMGGFWYVTKGGRAINHTQDRITTGSELMEVVDDAVIKVSNPINSPDELLLAVLGE